MGSLPSEAAGSSTAGLSKWGSGLQTRIRAGERRLLSNSTANYTTTSANSMVTTAATTTPAPSTTAKKFEVKFTVSLPYSKADFTADDLERLERFEYSRQHWVCVQLHCVRACVWVETAQMERAFRNVMIEDSSSSRT